MADSEVPCFGRLPSLVSLYMGQTDPADSTMMPPVEPQPFESNGNISDRGLVSLCLSELDNDGQPGLLRRLSLAGTDVSDKCLHKLAAAFPLQYLDLRRTLVTAKGVQFYLQHRPTCEILHDEYAT